MFEIRKKGLIFSPKLHSKAPWMTSFAQAPSTLVFEDYLRVYFSTRPDPDSFGQFVSFTGFVDLDIADLTRIVRISEQPIMQLGGKGTFDEFGVYPFSAVRFGERILGFHGGWTRPSSVPFAVSIGASESFDGGASYVRLGPGPVISASPNEPFVISGPKIRLFNGALYMYYIAGKSWIETRRVPEPVYRIRMAVSSDGISWKREDRDLIVPLDDGDEAQASPDVFWDGEIYHMFFCFRKTLNYRGNSGSYRLGYASSNDLLNWTRDDSKVDFEPSDQGWDSDMIAYPHVFHIQDHWYLLYLGNGVGREGFGMAEITFSDLRGVSNGLDK